MPYMWQCTGRGRAEVRGARRRRGAPTQGRSNEQLGSPGSMCHVPCAMCHAEYVHMEYMECGAFPAGRAGAGSGDTADSVTHAYKALQLSCRACRSRGAPMELHPLPVGPVVGPAVCPGTLLSGRSNSNAKKRVYKHIC
jgi:hypothetical protein